MSQINVNTITDEAGTGPVNFPYDFTIAGSALVIPPAHSATTVSGATQALNVGSYNFFNAGTLSADTTLSFTNVPTDALWTYTANFAILGYYSIQAAIYSGTSAYIGGQEKLATGIAFSSDGTEMYVSGDTGNDVNQYTLTTAWNINTASFTTVFSVSAQDIQPQDLAFSSDGTKMYIVAMTNDNVFQYTLGTAWDLSTASYASLFVSVGAQETTPRALAFSSDGTKMYVGGNINDTIYQYTLGTAWNVSTATYASISFSVTAQGAPSGITFNPDGTKMYIVNNTVYQYSLGTAWNVSTASYDSVSFTHLLTGGSNYSLGLSVLQEPSPQGLAFNSDGTKMFIVGSDTETIYEYHTTLMATITVPAAVQNPPTATLYPYNQVSYTFVTNDGGTTVKLINEAVT